MKVACRNLKVAVFRYWVVTLFGLVEVYEGSHPDNGNSKNLWNVRKRLPPDYTVQKLKIQPSSYSTTWERDYLLL